jgi:hypothetical protein
MPKSPEQALYDLLMTHSAECYKWHHECAIAEVERLRRNKKAIADYVRAQYPDREALEQQYQAGCTHCTHPQYVGIRCNVCGRWTEKT